ncbi:MAG: efflux RND transporter periplasmic adaptor subunit [Phycisphaerae bacterium]
MKNLIIVVLAAAAIVAGYVAASSTMRMSSLARRGETATVTVGDLTLPINATGEIKPSRRVEIKSEASGAVILIARRPGEYVAKDDLIIRLQRDDEERNVNRAELNVTIAEAALVEAKSLLEQARTADLDSAEANVEQVEASLASSQAKVAHVREAPDSAFHSEETVDRSANYQRDLAQLKIAQAAKKKAELAIPRAEQAVIRARANLETANNNLGDARKQLTKTDIVAPIDGIVADIRTQIGEVIQGGKSTLTGGTVLAVVLDMNKLILAAEVDEADIGRVLELAPPWARPGRAASLRMPDDAGRSDQYARYVSTITVETFPEESFAGMIERIYPEPRTISSVPTYLVDVVLTGDNKSKLLPGMRGEVSFTSEHLQDVLLCPNDAVRTGLSGEFGVYVPDEDASPEAWPVRFVACEIGLSDGAVTQIKSGLTEGMTVYTKLPARPRSSRKRDKERDG